MDSEAELPEDVIAEIEAGRKVTAVKLLRAHRGIGLKEAKELVDGYTAANPPATRHRVPEADTGIGRTVLLIIGVAVIFALYRYFT